MKVCRNNPELNATNALYPALRLNPYWVDEDSNLPQDIRQLAVHAVHLEGAWLAQMSCPAPWLLLGITIGNFGKVCAYNYCPNVWIQLV